MYTVVHMQTIGLKNHIVM